VIPDLPVAAEDAARSAHQHALMTVISREADQQWKLNLENALRTLSQ
jgi:hypothetical protein